MHLRSSAISRTDNSMVLLLIFVLGCMLHGLYPIGYLPAFGMDFLKTVMGLRIIPRKKRAVFILKVRSKTGTLCCSRCYCKSQIV